MLDFSSFNNTKLNNSVKISKERMTKHNKVKYTQKNDEIIINSLLSLNNKQENILNKLKTLREKAKQYDDKNSILDLEW